MVNQHSSKKADPHIGRTIREDFHNVKIKDDFSGEYKDLKEYFLTDERKEKLKTMGRFKKFFILPWWLLKALYFKLTPFRRLLLIVGIIFLFLSGKTGYDSGNDSFTLDFSTILSGLIFLFIIALELKDKLHAKTELEEGRAIQIALMPAIQPKVKGWDIWLYTKPANDVGGDLLDIIKLDDNKFGISIGDVAGKGLSAALLMAKLQATVRALAPYFKSLSELGHKINEIFYRDSLPQLFASLIYIELESGKNSLKIFNAGHLPPFVIKNNFLTKLEKGAPALGLLANPHFDEKSFEIKNNELLVAYSDGVTEARNENGNFFGEESLKKELSNINDLDSKQIGEKLIAVVDNFVGKAKVHDDLTIAILKRTH
jgi:hypothetical protein